MHRGHEWALAALLGTLAWPAPIELVRPQTLDIGACWLHNELLT